MADRISSLINIWGKDELNTVMVEAEAKTVDEKLLNGPQGADAAISQADVDALFD